MVQRAARYGPGAFVHFRSEKSLVDDLDRMVEELRADGVKGVTRSSVARTILRQGLDQDPTGGEVREVMSAVYRATQMALSKITSEVALKLPQYLDDAVLELDGLARAEDAQDGQPAE